MIVGLRVDVDTYRGTRRGVPALLEILERHGVLASFFFTVGPDNMGRHLWRLLRPAFLAKMLRTRAASLYGWDIILRGTMWPGPRIGKRCRAEIREADQRGHEVGLHAWDHHAWQAHVDEWDPDRVHRAIERGFETLGEIIGHAPGASATPGWRTNDTVLHVKSRFSFRYNSDCRGECIFDPIVDGETLAQPQIPVTLPTYDEALGRDGVTNANYNDLLFERIRPGALNVLTVHAEVEGIACAELFDDFLVRGLARGIRFIPLGDLLEPAGARGAGRLEQRALPGREGRLAWQGTP